MKVVIVAFLVTIQLCHAELGLTEQEMENKYGRPVKEDTRFEKIPTKLYIYSIGRKKYAIVAMYRKGKVAIVNYKRAVKLGEKDALTDKEFEAFRAMNSSKGEWIKDTNTTEDVWKTKDNAYSAARTPGHQSILIAEKKALILCRMLNAESVSK